MADGSEADEPIIWLRPERPARGKAPAYTRDDLAAAAVRVADAEGLDAVSMRRVATEIGAGTMSLYRYVRSRDELLALMADSLVRFDDQNIAKAHALPWGEYLRTVAFAMRRNVLDHPWYPTAAAAAGSPGPNSVRAMEISLAALDRPELSVDQVFQVLLAVTIFAQGSAQHELIERMAGPVEQTMPAAEQAYIMHLVESGNFPYLTKVIQDAATPHQDNDTQFAGMLDWLISGIEARLAR